MLLCIKQRAGKMRRADKAIFHQAISHTVGDEGRSVAIGSDEYVGTQPVCTYVIPTAYSKSAVKCMYTTCTWVRCSAMTNLRLWLGLPDSDNGGIGRADHIGVNGSPLDEWDAWDTWDHSDHATCGPDMDVRQLHGQHPLTCRQLLRIVLLDASRCNPLD